MPASLKEQGRDADVLVNGESVMTIDLVYAESVALDLSVPPHFGKKSNGPGFAQTSIWRSFDR
jgi:hypothetical protein